jgi:hypothetical protein
MHISNPTEEKVFRDRVEKLMILILHKMEKSNS